MIFALDSISLPYLFFGLPGGMEWVIILVVALLLFGRRLPDVARSLGKGIREFKGGLSGVMEEIQTPQAHAQAKAQQGTPPVGAPGQPPYGPPPGAQPGAQGQHPSPYGYPYYYPYWAPPVPQVGPDGKPLPQAQFPGQPQTGAPVAAAPVPAGESAAAGSGETGNAS